MIVVPDSNILTVSSGSSSIKFYLYMLRETESPALKGELARIGVSQGFSPSLPRADNARRIRGEHD
jgi:acetate kinase